MKVVILNGNPDPAGQQFADRINKLCSSLETKGIEVNHIRLRNHNIISCTGCWGCWVKTPGECLFRDDSREIRKEVIRADLLIFASPLIMGFTSALLKIMQDKLIPLVLPYIELVDNECHHEKRYEKYPKLGLVYASEPETDREDIQILTDIYKRLAINLRSELQFSKSIEEPLENLIHEIEHH